MDQLKKEDFPTKRYTFDDIKASIILENGRNYPRHRLYRSWDDECIYQAHKERMIAEWGSMDEYMKKNIIDNMILFKLIENNYPYHLEDGMEQFVLWSEKKLSSGQITDIIDDAFSDKDYVWFDNKVENKSIPGIEHVHVITRKKEFEKMNYNRFGQDTA